MSISHSQSTLKFQDIQELQKRVPVVGDKALIDLVNGIQVSRDIIRYRKNRGFIGRIINRMDGSDRKRQILLDGNLIAGQEALHEWVLELTNSLHISQVGLQVTQQSLLEARNAIRRIKDRLETNENSMLRLVEVVSQMHEEVGERLDAIEKQLRNLTVRVAAKEDLDQIIAAWEAEQTYTNLPVVVQVALLAREIYSSSVAVYEQEIGDTEKYRRLLVNKILATSQQLPKNFFGLSDLLDSSWTEMETGDLDLSAALLEIRSIPQHRLQNTPLLFAIGTTLELTTLPDEAKPPKPGQTALALCRTQIESISRLTDAREFVTAVVEETANDCIDLISKS